jgi:hypothetical protein
MAATIPTEERVVQWMSTLSNWGRLGDDDQRTPGPPSTVFLVLAMELRDW